MTIKKNSALPTQKPTLTPSAYNQVSDYRKATLQKEHGRGMWSDGSSSGMGDRTTSASSLAVSVGTVKTAQVTSAASGDWRGGGGTLRQMPDIYSPLWLNSNLNLPRDRATINAWSRSFFALQSFVQNAINLHSTYPISKLNIKCPNKKVETFFNEMNEEIGLQNICTDIAQEYWLLGEAFPFADLDENNAKWRRIFLQNPDFVVVKKAAISSEPIIMMRPDAELQRLVRSNKPADVQQRKQLNPTILEHIKRGENIPLDNFHISHLARKLSSYETRGTGLPVSCFRQLMLMDSIRECKYIQAQDLINPVTLIKIGSADYKATPEDLELWRNAWAQSMADKDFKIFTHEAVTVERIGANSAIIDTSGDITQLLKEIFMGLMIPEVIMTGGGDISYANGGISLDVLRQRYMQFRNMMAHWLKTKIFAPISRLNDFYEYENGEKKLIIPDVEWNRLTMFDTMDYINLLLQLSTGEDKRVSRHALYDALGLEPEEEIRKIKREDVQEAIRKKEKENLMKMSLNELRALSDDEEIPEITDSAVAADSPYDNGGALPGQTDPGGSGGMGPGGPGGLPPLPDLGGLGGGGSSSPPPSSPGGGSSSPPPPPSP